MNSCGGKQDGVAEGEGLNDHGDSPTSLVDGASVSKQNEENGTSKGRITVDAVHPFFTSYRNIEQYHCRECNEDFEMCPKALKLHFLNKKHTPVDKCIYCHYPVYDYIDNGKYTYYHKCHEDVSPPPPVDDSDDINSNTFLNHSILDEALNNTNQSSDQINSSISDVSIVLSDETDNTSI